jgi:hypothetical protein
MEDADLKAVHLVDLIYRDSGRGVSVGTLLSKGERVGNNFGGLRLVA